MVSTQAVRFSERSSCDPTGALPSKWLCKVVTFLSVNDLFTRCLPLSKRWQKEILTVLQGEFFNRKSNFLKLKPSIELYQGRFHMFDQTSEHCLFFGMLSDYTRATGTGQVDIVRRGSKAQRVTVKEAIKVWHCEGNLIYYSEQRLDDSDFFTYVSQLTIARVNASNQLEEQQSLGAMPLKSSNDYLIAWLRTTEGHTVVSAEGAVFHTSPDGKLKQNADLMPAGVRGYSPSVAPYSGTNIIPERYRGFVHSAFVVNGYLVTLTECNENRESTWSKDEEVLFETTSEMREGEEPRSTPLTKEFLLETRAMTDLKKTGQVNKLAGPEGCDITHNDTHLMIYLRSSTQLQFIKCSVPEHHFEWMHAVPQKFHRNKFSSPIIANHKWAIVPVSGTEGLYVVDLAYNRYHGVIPGSFWQRKLDGDRLLTVNGSGEVLTVWNLRNLTPILVKRFFSAEERPVSSYHGGFFSKHEWACNYTNENDYPKPSKHAIYTLSLALLEGWKEEEES